MLLTAHKITTIAEKKIKGLPAVALSNAEDYHAKANGGLVIVLEETLVSAQHDARVGPQPLEVGCVSGVAAHQNHSWHLKCYATLSADKIDGEMNSDLRSADHCLV